MHSVTLPQAVKKSWPTAKAQNGRGPCEHGQGGPDLQTEVMKWPTPAVMDVTGGDYPTEIKDGAIRSLHNAKGREQYYGERLRDAVKLFWPTASTRDWKDTPGMSMERDGQELGRVDQLARAVYFHQRGRLAPVSRSTDGSRPESWATTRSGKTTGESAETWEKRKKNGDVSTMPLGAQVNAWKTPRACEGDKPPMGDKHHQGLTAQARPEAGAAGGKLNPRWVETLMGLPMGWTCPDCPPSVIRNWPSFMIGWIVLQTELMSCGCAETESCPPSPQSHGELFTGNFAENDDEEKY
jgi:hypothetical protein